MSVANVHAPDATRRTDCRRVLTDGDVMVGVSFHPQAGFAVVDWNGSGDAAVAACTRAMLAAECAGEVDVITLIADGSEARFEDLSQALRCAAPWLNLEDALYNALLHAGGFVPPIADIDSAALPD